MGKKKGHEQDQTMGELGTLIEVNHVKELLIGSVSSNDEYKQKKWKKKKKKKKVMIGDDSHNSASFSASQDESVNLDGSLNVEGEKNEYGEKKRKKKIKGVSDTVAPFNPSQSEPVDVEGSSNVEVQKTEYDEKKRRKKKKIGGLSDSAAAFSASRNEVVNLEGKKNEHKEKNGNKKIADVSGSAAALTAGQNENVNLEGSLSIEEDRNEYKEKKRKKKIGGVSDSAALLSTSENNFVNLEGHPIVEKEKNEVKKTNYRKKKRKLEHLTGSDSGDRITEENMDGGDKVDKNKKVKLMKNGSGKKGSQGQKAGLDSDDLSKKSTSERKSKRVSFSQEVEVFPSSGGPSNREAVQEDGLVRGKRYSPEEDEMIKAAVMNYIDTHQLGEDGIEMVLHCKKYPEVKHCWKEIAAALPWRPRWSIRFRTHVLFERGDKRPWTEEELEMTRKFYEKNGSDWRTLADALGRHRLHVKDAWRRVKLPNMNKGFWSQDEYQTLFDLVNLDLRVKAFVERKSKHGMLRDNICWTAISDKLGTRAQAICCMKWYDQLTSPMVKEGKWLDTDDYQLVIELYNQDACCMEDVDWDNLLEHRSGDLCRKRWNEMVRHLGEHKNNSFSEQVDLLMDRYSPDVLEAREIHNSQPLVP
ncbi:hypothetical protein K2173_021225 [Erythroxylum novogranatense]|uniref:Myb-like domain-containing protein n=1 Tax=Erythroxylum novogranatense TaxID=1862640 RepID=A0AAV8TQL3_9ROSI|nr:hypothetical protein K2173_021225 [Erythroxylum novogranatense]